MSQLHDKVPQELTPEMEFPGDTDDPGTSTSRLDAMRDHTSEDRDQTPTEIIIEGSHKYRDRLPERAFLTLKDIDKKIPGMESESIKGIIENFDHLKAGGLIVLAGNYGCGKTVGALAGALLYQNTDRRGMGLLRIVRARAILKAAFDEGIDEYAKHRGVLVVDDLGREHFTDKGFGISEWDYFFDCRHSEMRPTIINTNLTSKQFTAKYNEAIYDRLKECAVWLNVKGKSLRKPSEVSS